MKLNRPKYFLIIILALSLYSFYSYGQNIILEEPELFIVNCDSEIDYDDLERIKTRIVSSTLYKDTLSIVIATVDNCIFSEAFGGYRYENDSIFLYYFPKAKGRELDCNCCFTFIFKFIGIMGNDNIIYFLNDKLIEISSQKYLLESEINDRLIIQKEDTINTLFLDDE